MTGNDTIGLVARIPLVKQALAGRYEILRETGRDSIVFLFNNRPQWVDEIYKLTHLPVKIFIRNQVTMITATNYIREAVQSAMGAEANRTDLVLSKLLQVRIMTN